MSLSQSEMTDIISQTHKTLDAAGVPVCDYFMSMRIPALIEQRDSARGDLKAAIAERSTVAAKLAAVIEALADADITHLECAADRVRLLRDDRDHWKRAAAGAERDTLPNVTDPCDPPVEGDAEATVKRLWSIIADHMPDINPATYEHTIEAALGSMVWHHHTQITIRDERLRRARAMLHAAIDREIDGD